MENATDVANPDTSAQTAPLHSSSPTSTTGVGARTDKHHEARKQLSKLYKKKQRKPSERSIMKYKNAKTEYAKLCRNSQEKDWSKFKAKTDNITV